MKPFYESKTVIFNIAMTIIMAVPIIATAYKQLDPNMAVLIDSVAGLVTGLGNIVLRVWFTDTPIETPKATRALERDYFAGLKAEARLKEADGNDQPGFASAGKVQE